MKLENFKSFRHLEVFLTDFNVVVGANASGKSSFFQIFRFLRDLAREDLDTAVAIQGGFEFFRNFNAGNEERVDIEIEFKLAENSEAIDRGLRFLPRS